MIGVDVGGTNTDLILVTGDEEFRYKTPTTDDPSRSTAHAVAEACERAGVDPASVERIFHGTTIATNSVIEHEGATTGMLTTEGFRDVIHIGRHRKPHNFSIQQRIPWQEDPVVERRFRKPIPERIYPPGDVTEPLDEAAVLEATDELVASGVDAISVCYMHSYLNPEHEDRTAELIAEEYPDVFVCTSNEVVAQFREFERFTTTAINASLQPKVSSYLDRISRRLEDREIDAEVLIMQSNGGLASVEEVSRYPVQMVMSGPSAGVLSGEFQGTQALDDPEAKLITLDMGGTSADISVLPGRVLEKDPRDSDIGGYPVISPMIDIETIGSGGGSIAWFDHARGFNIGPKSAGAVPGPACYGRGNDQPTVTDAQVVLGRINPDVFLGGEFSIDPDLSRDAIDEHLCGVVDEDRFATVERAATSALEVANTKMNHAIREQTVRRGYDPREYTLVAFGGAGPMHAVSIADQLDMESVLVPSSPGITSARGLLTGDIKYDHMVTVSQNLAEIDTSTVEERFETLERRGREQLERDGVPETDITFRHSIDCLYEGQGYELNVEFEGTGGDWRSRLRDRFETQHATEYGHTFEQDPVTLLNFRVTAVGSLESTDSVSAERGDEDPSAARTIVDEVYFGTSASPTVHETPRYDRSELRAGNVVPGPAIIDEADSTVVVNPGWTAEVLPNGAIELTGGN
jgi:N-methylhydantoinase A